MSSLLLLTALQAGLLCLLPEMGSKTTTAEVKKEEPAEVGQQMPESTLPGKWLNNLDEGQRLAAEFNVPLILHFEASWCGPCRQMASNVLQQSDVIHHLRRTVVGVRLDADQHSSVVARYGISSLPTEVILSPDGKELARHLGGTSLSTYVARLQSISGTPKASVATAVAQLQQGSSSSGGQVASSETDGAKAESPGDGERESAGEGDEKLRSCVLVKRDGKRVGLGGFSPVALIEQKVWEPGSDQYVADYEGVEYFFRSAEERDSFILSPVRFIPQLHGCDPVELHQEQRAAVGSIEYGAFYKGRLFFFANVENRRRFQSNPDWYATRVIMGEIENNEKFPFLQGTSVE